MILLLPFWCSIFATFLMSFNFSHAVCLSPPFCLRLRLGPGNGTQNRSRIIQKPAAYGGASCGALWLGVAKRSKFHGNERNMYGAIQGDSVIRLSLRVWYVCFCPLKHIWSDPPLCFSAWLCLFPFPFLVFLVIFVWKCGLRSESRSCANFCSFPAEISGIFSPSNWIPFCVLHFFCKLQRVLKVAEVPSIYSWIPPLFPVVSGFLIFYQCSQSLTGSRCLQTSLWRFVHGKAWPSNLTRL